ncbi:MAG: hypothetical protein ACRDLL_01620 [Solirubrobacterales bacterium]
MAAQAATGGVEAQCEDVEGDDPDQKRGQRADPRSARGPVADRPGIRDTRDGERDQADRYRRADRVALCAGAGGASGGAGRGRPPTWRGLGPGADAARRRGLGGGIGHAASRSGKQVEFLKREIPILRARISKASASEQQFQAQALSLGFIVPEPGAITYLQSMPSEAAQGAQRLASGALTAGDGSAAP